MNQVFLPRLGERVRIRVMAGMPALCDACGSPIPPGVIGSIVTATDREIEILICDDPRDEPNKVRRLVFSADTGSDDTATFSMLAEFSDWCEPVDN